VGCCSGEELNDVGEYIRVLAEVDEEVSGGVKFRTSISDDPFETYVHLKMALHEVATPDAKDRMENSNLMFEYTMLKILSLIRLFSYFQPKKEDTMEVPVAEPTVELRTRHEAETEEVIAVEGNLEKKDVDQSNFPTANDTPQLL